MPFVYLLQASVIARNPGIPAAALTTTMFYMLLVMTAAFSLRTWRIVLAAAVGAAFEVRLSTLTGRRRRWPHGPFRCSPASRRCASTPRGGRSVWSRASPPSSVAASASAATSRPRSRRGSRR